MYVNHMPTVYSTVYEVLVLCNFTNTYPPTRLNSTQRFSKMRERERERKRVCVCMCMRVCIGGPIDGTRYACVLVCPCLQISFGMGVLDFVAVWFTPPTI